MTDTTSGWTLGLDAVVDDGDHRHRRLVHRAAADITAT